MNTLKKTLAVTVITYLLIELVCFIFLKLKFTSAHIPTFHFQYNYKSYDFAIAEINPTWGTWHYPEGHVERKQCFTSQYHINSYGARDRERNPVADSDRIIMLGDSFIEGYGLNESERLSNALESATGREVLNFGCGYFTPTQEYLVYKHLAKNFSHNTVMVFILPFNDLQEDDTSFHQRDEFIHFQPYFQGTYPDYHMLYRETELAKSTFNKQGYFNLQNTTKQKASRFLKEFTCWYNIYSFIKINKPLMNKHEPFSGYYDCTKNQLGKLCFIISRLKKEAATKRIILVTIPVYSDFIRNKNAPSSPLSTRLDSFSKLQKIEYIDLLPLFSRKVPDPKELYFTCDGHWNPAANKMATEILLPLIRKQGQ